MFFDSRNVSELRLMYAVACYIPPFDLKISFCISLAVAGALRPVARNLRARRLNGFIKESRVSAYGLIRRCCADETVGLDTQGAADDSNYFSCTSADLCFKLLMKVTLQQIKRDCRQAAFPGDGLLRMNVGYYTVYSCNIP